MREMVLTIFLVALPTWAAAQEISIEAQRAGEIGKAALECGLLAAKAGDRYEEDALRLVEFAHEQLLMAMTEISSAMAAAEEGGLGPLGEYIRNRSPEFWVGNGFSSAARDINSLIDDQHPFGSGSFDTVMMLREFEAENEFKRRNCGFIVQ